MAYDPTIPQAANQVRGASGDLAKIRENFQVLSGAVGVALSGIQGLSGVDTAGAVSGDFLRYRGAGGNLDWVPSGAALEDLSNVDADSPASGQALVWDGVSRWTPGNVAAAGGGGSGISGFVLRSWAGMALSGDISIPNATPTTVTGFDANTSVTSGAPGAPTFTLDEVSGTITVPAGIGLLKIQAGGAWSGGAGGSQRTLRLYVDGAEAVPFAVKSLTAVSTAEPENPQAATVESPMLSVSGGQVVTLNVQQNGGTTFLLSGESWLYVEGYQVSGVGGGGVGGGGNETFRQCALRLPSGVNQTLAMDSADTITGMEVLRNVGGFAVNPASGVIEVPSGVTHIQVFAQVRYEAGATGDRRALVRFSGEGAVSGGGIQVLTILPTNGVANDILPLSTPKIPVSGGEAITLVGRHGFSSDLDVEWGFTQTLAQHQTYLSVEAFVLDDA